MPTAPLQSSHPKTARATGSPVHTDQKDAGALKKMLVSKLGEANACYTQARSFMKNQQFKEAKQQFENLKNIYLAIKAMYGSGNLQGGKQCDEWMAHCDQQIKVCDQHVLSTAPSRSRLG